MIRKASKKRMKHRMADYDFFEKIWDKRPHYSQISGKPLPYHFGPYMFFVFSHILAKGPYPRFRHKPDNILLMTMEEHQLWEFESHRIIDDPKWKDAFELKRKLKQKYYNQQ